MTNLMIDLNRPFVEFAIRTDFIAPLIKIIENLNLNQAEHRDRIEAKTEAYLQKALKQHGHEELILVELNMELDVKYLLMHLKNKNALSNIFNSSEIRNLELWKLEDLIKSLPEKYMGDCSNPRIYAGNAVDQFKRDNPNRY